jgi:hypothetical protein
MHPSTLTSLDLALLETLDLDLHFPAPEIDQEARDCKAFGHFVDSVLYRERLADLRCKRETACRSFNLLSTH